MKPHHKRGDVYVGADEKSPASSTDEDADLNVNVAKVCVQLLKLLHH